MTQDEAIISPAQGKGVSEYQDFLTSVFSEVARVMKPSAEATLVFHSSKASVWQALAASLAAAGLVVTAASILDKTQASFKQVNGHVAVSGDPLLRLGKSSPVQVAKPVTSTMRDLVAVAGDDRSARASITPRQQQHRYSAVVGRALVGGVPITMDARTVYDLRELP